MVQLHGEYGREDAKTRRWLGVAMVEECIDTARCEGSACVHTSSALKGFISRHHP